MAASRGLGALGSISTIYDVSSGSESENEDGNDGVVNIKIEKHESDVQTNDPSASEKPMTFDFPSTFNTFKAESTPKIPGAVPAVRGKTSDVEITGYLANGTFAGTPYRVKEEPPSDPESVDSESDSSSDSSPGHKASDSDSDSSDSVDDPSLSKNKGPPRVKGELRFEDLPPIQDLHISIPHEKTRPIGIIKSVVDPLVIVEALPHTPALDIGSILFLNKGDMALGAVFDVIGPVTQPFYCIRFNSLEHIASRGVVKGMSVYCAPASPKHTSYVLVAQLQKLKGTDASWLDDIEPPKEVQEFSDDEQERMVKKKGRKPRSQGQGVEGRSGPPPAVAPFYREHDRPERFPRFRRGMNRPPFQNYQRPNYYGNSDVSWHNHPASYPQNQGYSPRPRHQNFQRFQNYQSPNQNGWGQGQGQNFGVGPGPSSYALSRWAHPYVQASNWQPQPPLPPYPHPQSQLQQRPVKMGPHLPPAPPPPPGTGT